MDSRTSSGRASRWQFADMTISRVQSRVSQVPSPESPSKGEARGSGRSWPSVIRQLPASQRRRRCCFAWPGSHSPSIFFAFTPPHSQCPTLMATFQTSSWNLLVLQRKSANAVSAPQRAKLNVGKQSERARHPCLPYSPPNFFFFVASELTVPQMLMAQRVKKMMSRKILTHLTANTSMNTIASGTQPLACTALLAQLTIRQSPRNARDRTRRTDRTTP